MTTSNFNYSFYTLSATCCLLLFELYLRQVTIKKKYFSLCPPPLSLPFSPSFSISLFHPSYLPFVFIQYFSPSLSLPPSHFATSIPRVLNCVSLLICSIFCTFFVAIIVLFLALSLPRYSGISSDSLPSFLLVCIFVPFTQLYIHASSFCS
jgi:hypothetical protein